MQHPILSITASKQRIFHHSPNNGYGSQVDAKGPHLDLYMLQMCSLLNLSMPLCSFLFPSTLFTLLWNLVSSAHLINGFFFLHLSHFWLWWKVKLRNKSLQMSHHILFFGIRSYDVHLMVLIPNLLRNHVKTFLQGKN